VRSAVADDNLVCALLGPGLDAREHSGPSADHPEVYAMTPAPRFRPMVSLAAVVGLVGTLLVLTGCPFITPALTANAGPDQTVVIGATVTLEGSAAGGTAPYTYAWTPTTGLSSAAAAQPTFTPTTVGTITFTLTVTDANGATATDDVVVTVTTTNPTLVASAGADKTAAVGVGVALDGSATGGDGNYTYSWSPATGLSNASVANPTYTPTAEGAATFTLTVTDGEGQTDTDDVAVTVSSATTLSSLTWEANRTADGYGVLAAFSRELDQTTAEAVTNYRLNGTTTNPTSASLGADNRTVTLVFATALSTAATLDLSLNNGIQDSLGNPVPAITNQSITANTGDSSDPTVNSLTWAANFAGSYRVDIAFNESVDKTTAEATTAYRISATTTTATSATLQADGKTVQVVFDGVALSTTSAIDVGVGNALKDINGNTMTQKIGQSVTANASDTTLPSISSIQHSANFTSDGYEIKVQFDEAMSETDVEQTGAYKIGSSNATSATLGTDGRTVTLVFKTPLAIADKINISVGDLCKDINGNAMTVQTNQTISAETTDTTAPTVSSVTWGDGYTGGGYQVTVVFNESMDEATAESTANYRINGTSTNPTSATLGNDGKTVTLIFNVAMDRADGIDVSVGDTIKDINGNALTVQSDWSVAANGNDATGPTVSTRQWAANFAGPGYQVEIIFNEAMDETTAETLANYQIGAANDTPTAASVGTDGKTVTLTFTGIAGGLSTADQVDISVGGTIKDINNNTIAEALNQAIAGNAADTTKPTIASATETAAGNISVVFSEVLDNSTIAAGDFTDIKDGAGLKDATANTATLQDDGKTVAITHDGDVDTGNSASIDVATIDDMNAQTIVAVDDQAVN
jgi:hypothetical protein